MRRRELIEFAGTAFFAWPLVARAQQQDKIVRLGFLGFGTPVAAASRVEALRAGLRDLGYVEGKNLVIEFRWSGTVEQMQKAAAELARMKVDIIFATSSTETGAARQATKTIPIVFGSHADPVATGHVASLARPGGNITGLSVLLSELTAKALEILKELVPEAKRFGVLSSPTVPSHVPIMRAAEAAAEKLGVALHPVLVGAVEEFEEAFAKIARADVQAVFVAASSLTIRSRPDLLAQLALKFRLPSMFGTRDNVAAGGLMSYAPDPRELFRGSAIYIDKILKGSKPADLPVEQASQYQLTINLKAAKALDLTLPPALLARADEVIE